MVFCHFNNSYSFLPSPEQILQGIILAQMNEFKSELFEDEQNFGYLFKDLADIWKKIFALAEVANMKKPLSPKILKNPNH